MQVFKTGMFTLLQGSNMAGQIFISHSRDDENLLDELDRVFGKLPMKQYRASFEDQSPPVSADLKNEINESAAMIVVLGRNAQAKTHTMIWIGWEAGVAAEAGIPVWILEDVSSNVTEPIPSFTDYVLWDSQDREQKRILRDVLERDFVTSSHSEPDEYETPRKEDVNWGSPQRNSANPIESTISTDIQGIRCPYDSCGEEFAIRFEGPTDFNCPSCRHKIVLEDDNSDTFSW